MNLKLMSDDELHLSTQRQAGIVRNETTVLLQHLCEVRRRRLFAKYGCKNLFSYCVKVLKMSEPQAGRSVNAAQTLQEFPEVEEKVESGALCFTVLSQAQGFFKREAKAEHSISKEVKKEILEKLENQSTREVERILLSHSASPEKPVVEGARRVSQSTTEIKLAVDNETLAHLDRLKEIWSHEMPGATYSDLIKKMAGICQRQFDPTCKAERAQVRKEMRAKQRMDELLKQESEQDEGSTAQRTAKRELGLQEQVQVQSNEMGAGETSHQKIRVKTVSQNSIANENSDSKSNMNVTARTKTRTSTNMNSFDSCTATTAQEYWRYARVQTRYIPAAVRHAVWMRDGGCCTFVDPLTGEACGSRHMVQCDHVIPYAMGGQNTVENLRLRCFAHNQWHAMNTYGPKAAKFMRC